MLTARGRTILALPEDKARHEIKVLDRKVRDERKRSGPAGPKGPAIAEPDAAEDSRDQDDWREVLLSRLHRLTPQGFEEFVIYLLKTYGMELERVGGSGDEGIDGIGLAPISPVLSSRVAVQAKRYDPTSAVGREVVALFQRDAAAAGAERAVLVTLGRFTSAARRASTAATPMVNLIDGDRLCELVEQQGIGIRQAPIVLDEWFDRFDTARPL